MCGCSVGTESGLKVKVRSHRGDLRCAPTLVLFDLGGAWSARFFIIRPGAVMSVPDELPSEILTPNPEQFFLFCTPPVTRIPNVAIFDTESNLRRPHPNIRGWG